MAIAAMKKFQMIGLKEKIDLISSEVIKSSNVELISKEIKNPDFRRYSSDNPYQEQLAEIEEIISGLGIEEKKSTVRFGGCDDLKIEEIKKYLKPLKKRLNKLKQLEKKLDREEQRLINLKHHIYLMRNMDIELEELRELSYITLVFGSTDVDSYERLIENITGMPILVLEVTREGNRVWFFTFAKKDLQQDVINTLKSAYFEEIKLPPRVKGQPSDILKRAEHRLERIEIIREQISLEYKKMCHRASEQLLDYFQQLSYLNKVKEIENEYYREAEYLFVITGWITAGQEKGFAEGIGEKYPDVIYASEDVVGKEGDKPPTVMENPGWAKPFESLVKLYGIPAYHEIDPTKFLAFTYILMFGMMFGDLGQGFIFVLLGWLIYTGRVSITSRENSLLFISLGVSSMFFGLLYGSVFAVENILPALLFRPMENIMTWLGVTVILGIILLLTTMSFNLANSYRESNVEDGVFSRNGLAGIFFYLFSLSSLASLLLRGKLLLPPAVTISLLLLPLLIIFFKKPLSSLVEGRGWKIGEKASEYYMESLFELLDAVLGYMSNTISFVRIGAFTLNHAGLSMAVMILARMMKNSVGSVFILIAGNLIIMGLEGLVVGIQILRLEFFELFGKFYHGDGKEFNPVRINNRG